MRTSTLSHIETTRINNISIYSERGEVRCLSANDHKVWVEAMKEISEVVERLNSEGYDVEVKFRNQIDEITPCNREKSLFYFDYYAKKVEVKPE